MTLTSLCICCWFWPFFLFLPLCLFLNAHVNMNACLFTISLEFLTNLAKVSLKGIIILIYQIKLIKDSLHNYTMISPDFYFIIMFLINTFQRVRSKGYHWGFVVVACSYTLGYPSHTALWHHLTPVFGVCVCVCVCVCVRERERERER